jgi:hypothetical protein
VLDVEVVDVTGDGRKDVVVAHLVGEGTPAVGRRVSIFTQRAGPEPFSAQASFMRDVPAHAVAFAAADLDPRPGCELAFLGTQGVSVLRSGAKDPPPWGAPLSDLAVVSTQASFFENATVLGLPRWDLCVDLDRDGRLELIVPTREGYLVLKNDREKGLVPAAHLSLPTKDRYGPSLETKFLNRFLTFTSTLPRIVAADLDGDGRLDLVAHGQKGLARFLQRPGLGFGPEPDSERRLKVEGANDDAEPRGELPTRPRRSAFANVRLQVADLDQDGFSDLVATRTQGEVGVFETLRTQFLVYKGGPEGWNTGRDERPSKVLNQRGVSMDPLLIDWNGDGDKDLIVSALRVDHLTNLGRAITKSMTITYAIYLYRGGKEVYPSEPDFTRDVVVDLSALERRGGAAYATFDADVNGDRLKDMVVRVARDKIQVVPGGIETGFFAGKRLVFDERASLTMNVPPNACVLARDVFGKGRDALLLMNPAPDDPERTRVRIVSVGGR